MDSDTKPPTPPALASVTLLARVELAIAANGGPDYDEKACDCEPEVNAGPCRYCAIRDALNEMHRWLKVKRANK